MKPCAAHWIKTGWLPIVFTLLVFACGPALGQDEVGRARVDGRIATVVFSPDGRRLLCGSQAAERPVRAWTVESGRLVEDRLSLEMDRATRLVVQGLALSPDGRTLAITGAAYDAAAVGDSTVKEILEALDPSDTSARLFDLKSGKLLHRLEGGDLGLSVAFSPDGKLVAASDRKGQARVFDVKSGKLLQERKLTQFGPLLGIAFSPDGRTLAGLEPNLDAMLWDLAAPNDVAPKTLKVDRGSGQVAFSPDGKQLACCRINGAMVFDLATGQPAAVFAIAGGGILPLTSVAFTPDGKRLLTGEGIPRDPKAARRAGFFSGSNSVRVWQLAPKQQVAAITTLTNAVTSVAVSPDGKLIAAGDSDGNVRLWKMPK